MTHNRFSDFHCVYTILQVVHTEFIKVVLTEYSAFKSLTKNDSRASCSSNKYCTNSYRVFNLQKFEQNNSRTSCSSNKYCTNFTTTTHNEFWTIFLPPLLTQENSKSSLNLLATIRRTPRNFLFQKVGIVLTYNLHITNAIEDKN